MVHLLDIDLDKIFKNISAAMSNGVKQVFLSIDSGVYRAFKKVFELFFEISKVEFLSGDFYAVVFKRVFLILSVFMLFRLTVSFISYLISPDSMVDPKNPGNLSKLIGRVVVSILLLIILVPIGSADQYAQNAGAEYQSDDYKTATNKTMEQNIQVVLLKVYQQVP